MIPKGGLSGPDEEYIRDEYVVGIQTPTQLTSSLAFLLREPNYLVLYDTSIFCSPEQHLKKHTLQELNKDFLYKWYLFFTGIHRNLDNYKNLIVIPEVAEEISQLIRATLFVLDKRKKQYRMLSPEKKDQYRDVFEQLIKNEEVLLRIVEIVKAPKHEHNLAYPEVFDKLLEIIKFLDDQLGLKKPNSREINDTDERLAARTFYELIINNQNMALYTRDDDIRKLISATFKLLVSRQLNADQYTFIKRLSFHNILVLKYNYEKKVFSRFFESSTLSHLGEFRFPRKLGRGKIAHIINHVQEILRQIDAQINKIEVPAAPETSPPLLGKDEDLQFACSALDNLFQIFLNFPLAAESAETIHQKLAFLEHLKSLAQVIGHQELLTQLEERIQENRQCRLKKLLQELQEESRLLEAQFDALSSQDKTEKDWQKIQSVVQQKQENFRATRFFENALAGHYYDLTRNDYERFKELLRKFEQDGYRINEKDVVISTDQIAKYTGKDTSEIIKIIEMRLIEHQGTQAYINENNIIHFL